MEEKITGKHLPAYNRLKETLLGYGSLAIAFSGGTDSTFLLYVAHTVLKDKVKAFTVDTDYMVREEIDEAALFCRRHHIPHEIIHVRFPEEIRNNPPDRCYLCKRNIFRQLGVITADQGFTLLADGSHTGDLAEYRPGRKALKEQQVKSPLLEARLSKPEIREMANTLGLPNWDLPSNACLLTRLSHDYKIDPEILPLIEAGEKIIRQAGFYRVRLRLRTSGTTIEVGANEIHRFNDDHLQQSVFRQLTALGFTQISIDPEGYRTGKMEPRTLKNMS